MESFAAVAGGGRPSGEQRSSAPRIWPGVLNTKEFLFNH